MSRHRQPEDRATYTTPTISWRELDIAVNHECICEGGGPDDEHTCPACRVYHRLVTANGKRKPIDMNTEIERLTAEIERWRDSNNRLRAEMEHQARVAGELRHYCGYLEEQLDEHGLRAAQAAAGLLPNIKVTHD